jgi:uncharacterized protein
VEKMTVPAPKLLLIYEGKDISADVSPYLIDATYTDYLDGESDTLELRLEDKDGRWMDAWYPKHGDKMNLQMGYENEPLLPCGDFELDEIELDGPPDIVVLKALATGVKRSVRTRNGRHYENSNLQKVAADIAQRNKLALKTNFKKDFEGVAIAYVAQAFETDLGFLHRVLAEYGYAFTVRGSSLFVHKLTELKAQKAVVTLGRSDLKRWRFKDKVHLVYDGVEQNYHDPKAKAVVSSNSKDVKGKTAKRGADKLKLNLHAVTPEQAEAKSQAALERANDDQTAVTLEMDGDTRLMAGLNVLITEFGKLNGKYMAGQSSHRFSRSEGYCTTLEAKRVRSSELGG